MESGYLMEAGGLWESYVTEIRSRTGFFEYMVQKNLDDVIWQEDREEYRKSLNLDSMKEVFIKDVHSREILNHRMEQIYAALKESEEIPLSCSAGISFVDKQNYSYETVIKQADEALYRSKKKGKNQFCYYEPEI